MAAKLFAAIDVGSFELGMKIYEMSKGKDMRVIEEIRRSLDLGSDTYTAAKLSSRRAEELCLQLQAFNEIMKSYKVDDFRACGTSAIRESRNMLVLLDHVQQRTGITIDVLSNSEQRYMDYKSVAYHSETFNQIIEKDTLILDIGGGSIQLSLFEGGTLTTSQNLRLGVLRLQERLQHLNAPTIKVEELITEMISSQLAVFKKLYLKDKQISNVILIDDYLSTVLTRYSVDGSSEKAGQMRTEDFNRELEFIRTHSMSEVAEALDVPGESVLLFFISAMLVKMALELTGAELLWAPGVCLSDGMAYEYAEQNGLLRAEHDFEADIISAAHNIRQRFRGSRKRSETLEKICLSVFDSMKKVHGMGKREKLLLRIAAILHDCGKYISVVNLGECSYDIILHSEIIGLSHKEREIVANVVRFNHVPFEYFDELQSATIDREAYLTITKLTAILRVANGLDRSHKQKFKDVRCVLKDDRLMIYVDPGADITLERGLFDNRAEFFREVFSVEPVIRQKKI